MHDFRRLRVWQRSHRLSIAVNERLARPARRGFTHVARQAQRAASSIPSNIVEGCGHESWREFVRYLRQAGASADELEYHLIEARDLKLLDRAEVAAFAGEVREVRRMLLVLIERTRRREM
jgi:four helix bundle protein